MSNGGVDDSLEAFLRYSDSLCLQDLKKTNLNEQNMKKIESNSWINVNNIIEKDQYDLNSRKTLSLCFKCLYLIINSYDQAMDLLRKHQIFIIKLLDQKLLLEVLNELNTLNQALNKFVHGSRIQYRPLSQKVFEPIPFVQSDDNPIFKQIIVYHFLVLQTLIQFILKNMKLILTNKDTVWNYNVLQMVSESFLKSSDFNKWINVTSNPEDLNKYHRNSVKTIKGFLKATNAFLKYKANPKLELIRTSFILKSIEYENDTSMINQIVIDSYHMPFIDDLRDHPHFNDVSSKIVTPMNGLLNILNDLIQTRDIQIIKNLNLCLLNSPEITLDNDLIKYIMCFDLDTSTTSLEFMDTVSSIIQTAKVSRLSIPVIDKFFAFSQKNVKMTQIYNYIYSILNKLYPVLEELSQNQKLRMISNLLYNMGTKSRDPKFWKASIDIEFLLLNSSFTESNYNQLLNKGQKVLSTLFDLKQIAFANDIAFGLAKSLDKAKMSLSNTTNISKVLCKLSVADPCFLQNLLKSLSVSLRVEISVAIFQLLAQEKPTQGSYDVLKCIFEEGRFDDESLALVAYHYHNIGDKDNAYEIEVPAANNLLSVGIFLRKLLYFSWDESLLLKSIKNMKNWIIESTSSPIEQEIFTLLIEVLKFNGALGYIPQLIDLYLDYRKPNLSYMMYLYTEMCHGSLHMNIEDFPMKVLRVDELLKSNKTNNTRMMVGLNMLQYEYFLATGNVASALGRFEKLHGLLSTLDEFAINPTKTVPMEFRYKNVMTIAKFQLLTGRLNIMKNDQLSSYFNFKTGIQMSYSLITSTTTKISKDRMNFLRWEATIVLFELLNLMMRTLLHLGMSDDLLFYLRKFEQLNKTNCIPLVNSINHLVIAFYYKLVKDDKKVHYSVSCFNELRDISLVRDDLEINCFYNALSPLMNMQILEEDVTNLNRIAKSHGIFTDLQHLLTLVDPRSSIVASGERSFSEKVLFGKSAVNESLRSLSKEAHFVKIYDMVKSLPCVSSNGISDSTEARIDVLNNLNFSKDLLFSGLNLLKSAGTYLIRDYQNVLNFCLVLLSSISVFETNSNLLAELYYLQDFANSLFLMHQKSLHQQAHEEDGILPEIINIPTTICFETYSMELNSDINIIPENWAIINIDLCNITGDLVLSKHCNGEARLFMRVPLKRFESRGIDTKTFQEVTADFKQIIADSNLSTKKSTTSLIKTKEERINWWKLRFSLDVGITELMEHIELYWFGGLASIFNNYVSDSVFRKFSIDFTTILTKYLPSRKGQPNKFMDFDENVIKLFYESESRDKQNVDDLIYYLLDSLALHGEYNKYDDMANSLAAPITKLLEKYELIKNKVNNEHIVLIPGVECSFFPWESLSFLRNRSVSRVPSVNILVDMLKHSSSSMTISDKSRLHYLINPDGDLQKTEKLFGDKFSDVKSWSGLIGQAPNEVELIKNLKESDLFVYLGHGGCDQYVKAPNLFKEFIKKGINLPPSLLIGCSSGRIQTNGILEPCGNILNWLTCGSPMVMVNLWDVTDKDIDIFSNSVVEKWGLFNKLKQVNICEAVCSSRDLCTLKYLNGAAPVVYGLPLHIN